MYDHDTLDLFMENILEKVQTPLRYPGSKFRASKYILPHLQVNHEEYREPFLGSGAIYFTKHPVKDNWLNDIDTDLITTFQVIADEKSRLELLNLVTGYLPTKENFEILKNQKFIDPVEVAYRYFVLNRTAYSGIMNLPNWGFHPTKSVQPEKWPERIIKAGKRLQNAKITNLDFDQVIQAPSEKKVLNFIDPPYFLADQKRAYFHHFETKDHYRLHDVLKVTNHKFCLTYDNCNEIKDLYSWANIHEYNWRYHTANSNTTTRKMGAELIITNY